jgi:hypothetical protein
VYLPTEPVDSGTETISVLEAEKMIKPFISCNARHFKGFGQV